MTPSEFGEMLALKIDQLAADGLTAAEIRAALVAGLDDALNSPAVKLARRLFNLSSAEARAALILEIDAALSIKPETAKESQ